MRKLYILTALLAIFAAVITPAILRTQPLLVANRTLSVDKTQAGRTAVLTVSATSFTRQAIGSAITATVSVDDGGSKLESTSVQLIYPADLLRFEQAAAASGSCGTNAVVSHNSARGIIKIDCPVSTPSNSQVATLATIRFSIIGSGDAYIGVDEAASKLTVRGSRREALRTSVPLTLGVGTQTTGVAIFSRTHPLSTSCSTASTAEITWLPYADAKEYRYSWSESPTTPPAERTTSTKLTLPVKPGAVHYLAVSPAQGTMSTAPVTRYRVASCE
jgi:hypothetical protein